MRRNNAEFDRYLNGINDHLAGMDEIGSKKTLTKIYACYVTNNWKGVEQVVRNFGKKQVRNTAPINIKEGVVTWKKKT